MFESDLQKFLKLCTNQSEGSQSTLAWVSTLIDYSALLDCHGEDNVRPQGGKAVNTMRSELVGRPVAYQ